MKTFIVILSVILSLIFSGTTYANESPELLPRCHQTDFNLCGFVDAKIWKKERQDVFVLEPIYEWASDFSDGLAAVRIDGKYGYIDVSGNVVIAPQYDQADEFEQGLAVVGEIEKGALGIIDKSGNYVVEPTFSYAKIFSDRTILGVSTKNSKQGSVDFGQYSLSGAGLYSVSEGWLTEQKYTFKRFADSKRELVWARIEKKGSDGWGNEYGLMRTDGNWFIEPKYSYVEGLKNNLAIVTKRTAGVGAIDEQGREVIPFVFDNLSQWNADFLRAGKGYHPNRKYGLVSLDGQLLANKYFEEIEGPQPKAGQGHTQHDFFTVKDNGVWKTLLKDGALLPDQRVGKVFIECEQFKILHEQQGYALVPRDKTLPTVQFDDIDGWPSLACNQGTTIIRNSKYAKVLENGKVFGGFFEHSSGFFGMHRWIQVDNKWGLVDADGSFSIEPIYTSIQTEGDSPKNYVMPTKETETAYIVTLDNTDYLLSFINGQYKQNLFVEPLEDHSKVLDCKGDYRRKSNNGLWGTISENGEELIPSEYRAISCFYKGVAWVPDDTKGKWCPLDRNNRIRSAPACQTVWYASWWSHHDPEKFDKEPYESSVLWMKAMLDYGEGRRDQEPRFVPWSESKQMNVLPIYALGVFLLLMISTVAFIVAPKDSRLPMQWGANGQINWSAPLKWAVLLMPAIAIITFGIVALAMLWTSSKEIIPATINLGVAIFVCLLFISIHMGHIYFALKHVRRG